MVMGVLAGSIPWYTMMILQKRSRLMKHVDDTLGVIHIHGVAGLLGGLLTGLLANPTLCNLFLPVTNSKGAFYGGVGGAQFGMQLAGALFIVGWNVAVTSIICVAINCVVPLRMPDEKLEVGDDAVHGEEAYALWGDGEIFDATKHSARRSWTGGRRGGWASTSGAAGVEAHEGPSMAWRRGVGGRRRRRTKGQQAVEGDVPARRPTKERLAGWPSGIRHRDFWRLVRPA
ncbi:hypothetical protein U9M48_000266 [Paspalum notatum var. saurae]|uniref:Ammonium transporter AmtB-like domain-containing protein n=1 Tax=Paspalum notatum var. saurae TaxID=547442 RepID=A0AAQ3SHC0_PASNO